MTTCLKFSDPNFKIWRKYLKKSVFWKSWKHILGRSKKNTDTSATQCMPTYMSETLNLHLDIRAGVMFVLSTLVCCFLSDSKVACLNRTTLCWSLVIQDITWNCNPSKTHLVGNGIVFWNIVNFNYFFIQARKFQILFIKSKSFR